MIAQTFLVALLVAAAAAKDGKPCRCTFDYSPLCGSDRVVYPNKCLFNCAKEDNPSLTVLTEGLYCPESKSIEDSKDTCICTMEMRPLCGSDNQVYGNPCLFDCAKKTNPSLTVLHTGNCDSEPELLQIAIDPPVSEPCICTREFKPVCGSTKGKEITYGNQCEFNCALERNPDLRLVSATECGA